MTLRLTRLLAVAAALSLAAAAHAALVIRNVDYTQGGVALQGTIAYDDSLTGPRPGVVVYPEWWGLNDYARGRAAQLAALGYVAFAADVYGRGVVTTEASRATALSGPFYAPGSTLMVDRGRAALDQLLASGLVDPARVAAIGYCFGGSICQQVAYSGAPLVGIVSFHGALIPAPAGAAARNHAKFLVCHGAVDPFVKKETLDAFKAALDAGHFDYQLNQYAGAVHAFTNPGADALAAANGLTGKIGYSPTADRRSWADMRGFLAEVFAR